MAIDATVVLGLAGKASQVFAEKGTYLSFPLTSIGLESSRMRALVADPNSPDGQAALAEFSLLVNEIPDGPLWQPGGDHRLWDLYGDVLTGVELAEDRRSPKEEADYRRAYALLYATQPDGSVVDSAVILAYEQYRDAYFEASYEYNNRKSQAESASSPAVAQKWAEDEPVLLERVSEAQEEWANIGHKTEVEDARRLLQKFGSRSPAMVWGGYLKLFDPKLDIFFRTAVDNSLYVPTVYAPSDVVDLDWQTIRASRDELAAMAGAAPEDLRTRLSDGSVHEDIQSVSFECSSVSMQRQWFVRQAFASRAWRFYESDRVLSDGSRPPTGECTAYVDGLVLARNITVNRKTANRPAVMLGFLPTTRALSAAPIARPQPQAAVIAHAEARDTLLARVAAKRPVRILNLGAAPEPVVRDHRRAASEPGVPDERTTATVALPVIPAVRQPSPVRPAVPLPPEEGAGTTITTDPKNIYILAFICRLLPKSPNPDPALTW